MSYDNSTTYETHAYRHGQTRRMLQIYAGSYNAGNSPAYGEDWEYYEVEIIEEDTEIQGMWACVKKKKFDTHEQALEVYEQWKKEIVDG